jgi:hypothetical protein
MPSSRSTANLPVISRLLLAAGALFVVEVTFAIAAPAMTSSWLAFLAEGVLTVAFALLGVPPVSTALRYLRVAFVVAAVGWGLLALASILPGVGTLSSLASLAALVGTLGAGILVFLRRYFPATAALIFLVSSILGSLLLLDGIRGVLPGGFVDALTVLFGAGLIATGVFLAPKR